MASNGFPSPRGPPAKNNMMRMKGPRGPRPLMSIRPGPRAPIGIRPPFGHRNFRPNGPGFYPPRPMGGPPPPRYFPPHARPRGPPPIPPYMWYPPRPPGGPMRQRMPVGPQRHGPPKQPRPPMKRPMPPNSQSTSSPPPKKKVERDIDFTDDVIDIQSNKLGTAF